jgi:hypothetical protein
MATRNHALYKRLPQPPADAAQGACYLSGSGGDCVDTGVNIWNEGTLVLSTASIRELAEVAGFNVVDGVELEVRNAELEHEVEQLKARVIELDEELEVAARLQARKQRAQR